MGTDWTWPEVVLVLGLIFLALATVGTALSGLWEVRKTKIAAQQKEDLRQLVQRYEQLAENTLDAQQRTAADVSELRTRAASIEQILRTVEA